MECKRFGKGFQYDQEKCDKCPDRIGCEIKDDYVCKWNDRAHNKAAIECRNCNNLVYCDRCNGLICSSFKGDLSLNNNFTGECDNCKCSQQCIDIHCKTTRFRCTKSIKFIKYNKEEISFEEGKIYTFDVFENKIILNYKLLTTKDSKSFNNYFKPLKSFVKIIKENSLKIKKYFKTKKDLTDKEYDKYISIIDDINERADDFELTYWVGWKSEGLIDCISVYIHIGCYLSYNIPILVLLEALNIKFNEFDIYDYNFYIRNFNTH